MAAPVLANRVVVFVNKIGTDDAGYNPVGAPWSRLTIAAALADLLANYPAGTIAEPTELTLGPGTYTVTADLAIPPNVFITGSGDADSAINTVIQLVGADIILDPDWADGACIGGLANLVVRGEGGVIDFTVPVPGVGNPARRVSIENVTTDVDLVNLEATSTADICNVDHLTHDGNLTNNFTVTGGTIWVNNTVSRATNTVGSKAGFAGTALLTANYFAQLVLSQVATALTVLADVLSLATRANLSQVGAPTITYVTDANGLGYSPLVPGNWTPVPVTVQQALDELAASVGPGGGPLSAIAFTNAAGNTTLTPTGRYYSVEATFTGAAGTRVLIADVAAPPKLGDKLDILVSRVDAGGVVVEIRDATAGGTLLATVPTGAGIITANVILTYGTIVGGFAANAWVLDTYKSPGRAQSIDVQRTAVTNAITNDLNFPDARTLSFGTATPASITGSAGAMTMTLAGTNRSLTVTPSGTGQFLLGTTGAAGTPGFSWVADPTKGIYSAGAGQIGYAINGSRTFLMDSSGALFGSGAANVGFGGNAITINATAASSVTITNAAVTTATFNSSSNAVLAGSLTTSQTLGIVGTTTNNNAAAGAVGETVAAVVAAGSAVSLTTATAANVTSISLTAGDWDVSGNVNFTLTGATTTAFLAGISSTSATLPTDGSQCYSGVVTTVLSDTDTITMPTKRFSLSATTTIYLVASSTFGAGTVAAFGAMTARRRR